MPSTIFHLEMTHPSQLNGKGPVPGLDIVEARIKQYGFNRFLYSLIGGIWQWTDKLSWTDEQWKEYAECDELRLWVAYCEGSPAGYYELQKQPEGNVEIMYFGLAEKFIGKGLGGYLLTHAIESAWSWGDTRRVWVHTCSLDHPSALQNYQARGMHLFKVEEDVG